MIDLREHDTREHAPRHEPLAALKYSADLRLAQGIRQKMREQGLRVPLTDAELFAQADERMRANGQSRA